MFGMRDASLVSRALSGIVVMQRAKVTKQHFMPIPESMGI